MRHTEGITPVSLETWKKEVKPEWKTWCGNLLPLELPAVSDGYSIFLEEKGDEKRYAKLKRERSYRCLTPPKLVMDTTGAHPLELDGVWDVTEWLRGQTGGGASRIALKYVARLASRTSPSAFVNAQRLRCAMMVAKAEHPWLGHDGWVYLCDRPDTDMDLFGDAPAPQAAVAPLTSLRSFELETLL